MNIIYTDLIDYLVTGICWQRLETPYLLPLLEQSSTSGCLLDDPFCQPSKALPTPI